MAFEPQQWSALEIALKVFNDERFDFMRTLYGNPIYHYNIHTGKTKLPDGGTSDLYAGIQMSVRRLPLKYGRQLADKDAIKELRGLLGEEIKNSFSNKNIREMWLHYHHLDESYDPCLPEKIGIHIESKEFLENPHNRRRIARQQVEVWVPVSGWENPRTRSPFSKREDIAFLSAQQAEALERFKTHHRRRGVKSFK